VTVDAIGFLDRIEDGPMPRKDRSAVLDARVIDQDVEIIPERLREFGLGVHQIHDPKIRGEAGHLSLEDGPAHTATLGLRPQPSQTAVEIGGGSTDGLRRHQRVAGGTGFPTPFRGRRCGRRGRCGW
jgi:hypothetical protein